MRVAYFSTFAEGAGGGMGRVAFELVEAMKDLGNDILFVLPGDNTECKKDVDGVNRLFIKSYGSGNVRIPALGTKIIKSIYKALDEFSPNVLHVHDQGALQLVGLSWALETNTPVVMTFHVLPSKFGDFGLTEMFNSFFSKFAPLVSLESFDKYSKAFYKNVTAFIALNEPIKKELADMDYKDIVYTIPNGRFLSEYSRCKIPNILDMPKRFVYIGYITVRKNQKYLIEIFKKLSDDYRLELIGEALDSVYLKELKRYAQGGNNKNVAFVGPVDYKKIPGYLEKAHYFLSASSMEVQSLAVIEALASGTPVIGLSNETVDEFIDASVGFRFKKDTPPEVFAQKIRELCSIDQQNYEALCERACSKVKHLDWADVAAETNLLYQKLVSDQKMCKRRTFKDRWEVLKSFLPKNLEDDLDLHGIALALKETFAVKYIKNRRFVFLAIVGVIAVGAMYIVNKGLSKLERS